MAFDPDDIGDAKSREEARNYAEKFERKKSDDPVMMAFTQRWVPSGSRHMDLGDLISIILGIVFMLAAWGGHIFGYY